MSDLLQKCVEIVEGTADSTLLHNNANKDSSRVNVIKNMLAGEVIKEHARHFLGSSILKAHDSGYIHFHDMDESPLTPMYNCCLVNLEDMLGNGFTMGNAEIESPKSITTAAAVTVQIIANVASSQYGGVSIDRIDEVLAPYAAKSYEKHLQTAKEWMSNDKAVVFATNMTHKEVDDACQAMEYEINTLYTSQGQTPFITFGFGLGTSWQAKAIQRGILQQRIAGLGKKRKTAIFPKLVYMLDDKINMHKGDCNYKMRELAIACAARRNYPDVLSMPQLRKENGGCTPMGCRSFLHEWRNPDTGEQEWAGRNNLGVVSINVPRIALEAKGNVDLFQQKLEASITVAKEALDARVNRLRNVKAKVAPILYCEGALGRLDPEDNIWQLFENGRASVSLGYIGLHEAANAMFPDIKEGALHSDTKRNFQLDVVKQLKAATESWKAEGELGYGLYSTPSESLCDRFCRIDEKEFGVIPGVTDKGYYTNSFHLDVEEKVSPMVKIDFEACFHPIANSGRISYCEVPHIPRRQEDLLHIYIDEVWKYAADKVAYFGTNCTIDYCHECDSDIDAKATTQGYECPKCGNSNSDTLEVTKRVCGYLGSPNSRPFIRGKQQEVINRVKHGSEVKREI